MNITREDIDDLNAVLKVDIAKADYDTKVEKILKDYRKSANIPGFRKGHVPMGLVKKQYGKAVLVDEVNKLLQENLNKYLTEEKLNILGNPLPKNQADLDWSSPDYTFEFELGLAPDFELNLQPDEAIKAYKIIADDKMVDDQIENIQKQYGKLINKDTVEEGDEVTASFKNEEEGIDSESTFELSELTDGNAKSLTGKKPGDSVSLNLKDLFKEERYYYKNLKIDQEEAEEKDGEVNLMLEEVNRREPADLDQELFDKLYGEGKVTSVTELKDKISKEAEAQFVQQSDQQLLNNVTESLIENTKFDLPAEFLTRWIQTSGEEELSEEAAKKEYERSEKGLRYQLIEGKLVEDNKLQLTFDEMKAYTKEMIRMQMAQYGQMEPEEQQVDDIVARILSNEEEAKRLSEQLMNKKMLDFFKENVNLETKEVTFEDFVKEVYN